MQINPTDENQNDFYLLTEILKAIDTQRLETTFTPYSLGHPLLSKDQQYKKTQTGENTNFLCIMDLDITKENLLQKDLSKISNLLDKKKFVRKAVFAVFNKTGDTYTAEEYIFKKLDSGYDLEKKSSNEDLMLNLAYTDFFKEKYSRVFLTFYFDIQPFVYMDATYYYKDKYNFATPKSISFLEGNYNSKKNY